MPRRFNTTGPCDPELHYMVPALDRLPEAPGLVEQGAYFVVHAPRQTGKTTALRALGQELTRQGRYAALRFTCEAGRAFDDPGRAERVILQQVHKTAGELLPPELRPPAWPDAPDGSRIGTALAAWARSCPRPLVLFFDEIDALRGDVLLSVLSQLRGNFDSRPAEAPYSVVLCGLRDVRDYKMLSGGDPTRLGTSSPFNVKLASLRLGNFAPDEVAALYGQHTAETGQEFAAGAIEHAYELSGGQPWLVNALAREVIERLPVPPDETITIEHLEEAKERLILARATHLDSLAAKLAEPRVRGVLGPVLAGELLTIEPYDDDVSYVRDLGLIAQKPPVRVANPIYREVIVRVLADRVQENVVNDPRSFVRADGTFDMPRMLEEFAEFWVEHGEFLTSRGFYHEAAPQLVFMGFLQRVVNGGGYVDREYGVGSGRVDLNIRWPHTGPDGRRRTQREAVELKVWRDPKPDPQKTGLRQLDRYLDRLSLPTGTLVVFDQRAQAPDIADRTQITTATTPTGRTVTLMRA